MSQKQQPNLHESLSALCDGETSEWEVKRLLAEMERDNSLRQEWQLHQLTSASLSKSDMQGIDLSARISEALENESRPFGYRSYLKPFSQVAVAASVAVFALLGIQQLPLYTNDMETPQNNSAVFAEQGSSDFQPVVIPEGFELPPLQTQTVSSTIAVQVNHVSETVDVPSFDKAELDKHIQDAISAHVENTSENLNSVLPLARQINVPEQ